MKYGLIFCLFLIFLLKIDAQITHPGKITTLDGKVIEGEIAPITGKTFFEGIQFIDASGLQKQYLPSDIKGFFVNEDYAFPATYESIHLDTLGTYFFHHKFEDGRLKYLFCTLPPKEKEEDLQKNVEVYMIDNQIEMIEFSLSPMPWINPKTEIATQGGIITAKGDTLRGIIAVTKSKIEFKAGVTHQNSTFELNKIRGFFNNEATYYIVDVTTPGEKDVSKTLCQVLIDGPVIQLVARQVDLTAYQQYYNSYYDSYGRLRQYPSSRKVRSGYALMYSIHNQLNNQVLNFLSDPFQPPTRLGNVMQLREWLKDYPALQQAALGNSINSEKAMVRLYNLHLELGKNE